MTEGDHYLREIVRAAGLDPDGRLAPMGPAWHWSLEACQRKDAEVSARMDRDAALLCALGYR